MSKIELRNVQTLSVDIATGAVVITAEDEEPPSSPVEEPINEEQPPPPVEPPPPAEPKRILSLKHAGTRLDGADHVFDVLDSHPTPDSRYDAWSKGPQGEDIDHSTAISYPNTRLPASGLPTHGGPIDIILRPPKGYDKDNFEPVTVPFLAAFPAGVIYPLELGTEEKAIGSLTDDDIGRWLPNLRYATGEEYLGVVRVDGVSRIRQMLEPSRDGSRRVVIGWDLPPGPVYRMQETILFEPGFEWGRTKPDGKSQQTMKCCFGFAGGSKPSASSLKKDGFTSRLNVHGNHLGGRIFDGDAKFVTYLYRADRKTDHGEITAFGENLPIGVPIRVVKEVKMNSSITESDGHIRVWVNGVERLFKRNIQWWSAGSTPAIDQALYSTFYGGNFYAAPSQTCFLQVWDVAYAPVIDEQCAIQPH